MKVIQHHFIFQRHDRYILPYVNMRNEWHLRGLGQPNKNISASHLIEQLCFAEKKERRHNKARIFLIQTGDNG